MGSLGLYAWATASLAGSTLNDFASPAGYLTAAVSSLIVNTPRGQDYLPSPVLPQFLPSNGNSVDIPWGKRTVSSTNPYVDIPNTGVTRQYDLTITRGVIAPDGQNKSSILINGQYPGPLVEANWGDFIEVTVSNKIVGPEEGTSLHWHGLLQDTTPWYDGTPGISQCPIAPGSSFKYKFRADVYGTSWYHSHFSAQYTGGAFGPLVVHGPSSADYDIDLGPVIVHDYYRTDYSKVVDNTQSSNSLVAVLNPSDNTFIHGGNNFVCALGRSASDCRSNKGLSKFNFTSGKTHRLRIINPSTLTSPMLFTIDNHTITVIANDFTPVVPYETNVVSLSAGQRTDIIVKANGAPKDSYWIRVRQPDICQFTIQPFGLAALYYEGADKSSIPRSIPHPDFNIPRLNDCKNDPLNITTPSFKIPAVSKPDTTITITTALTIDSNNQTYYTMNGGRFQGDYSKPILREVSKSSNALAEHPEWNLFNFGKNKTARVIFYNTMAFSHPMHLHGQHMVVLAEGVGKWDGKIVNQNNPQRRDTQIVQANGYMVFQFSTENAGVWPFHCHLSWHLSQAMFTPFVFQPQKLLNNATIATVSKQTCTDWDKFSPPKS